ncbi:MAG TPA: hypothetical protein VJR47_18215 [Stellaceae bacterium]|nr:hypothetical protein [Stellaceae bacterium]
MADIVPELQKLRHQVIRLGAAAKASNHPDIKIAFTLARLKLQERANELEAQLALDDAAAS